MSFKLSEDPKLDFEELIDAAESNASSGWEMEFCEDLRKRFNKYGDNMIVTDNQVAKLREIAKDD